MKRVASNPGVSPPQGLTPEGNGAAACAAEHEMGASQTLANAYPRWSRYLGGDYMSSRR
jgi:hypothetical protein